MPQQVILIHGGDVFENYEDYLTYLREKEVSLERLTSKGWKSHLGDDLGENFQVLSPKMPNPNNARYLEWRIWFEKLIPLFDDKVILIGHSLGGIFLAKYLSEHTFPKTITATFLIAAPYNTATEHPLVDFTMTGNLDRLKQQGGKIFLYHSRDDYVVDYHNVELYKEALPGATIRTFEDKGHFNMEHFPELVEDIKESAKK